MGKITQIKVNCDLIYEAGQNAGGGTGGADMIVNFTNDSGGLTMDKTVNEIVSAFENGQTIACTVTSNNKTYNTMPLSHLAKSDAAITVIFSGVSFDSSSNTAKLNSINIDYYPEPDFATISMYTPTFDIKH